MASLQELINYATFREQQRQPQQTADFGTQFQQMKQQIEEMDRQRKQKETQKRLWDIIQKQEGAGQIVPEYDVSAEGDISIKYKQPKTKYEFTGAVNKAIERIKAGEDFNSVALELETEFGEKYNETVEKHLKKVSGVEEEKKGVFTEAQVEKTLGDLARGGAKDIYGSIIPFNTREDAEGHIYGELGANWREKIPPWAVEQADAFLNKLSAQAGGAKEITLPTTIKTTSQALKHLMENYNMTKEKAIEWLRSQ